jgi:hypothetical protein
MWKVKVATGSETIDFSDTLECAAAGEVKKATLASGNTIAGKAMTDGSAGKYILMVPITAIPTAASS